MIPSMLPNRPWEKIGTDLFEFKGTTYLLLVDYYLRYIEVVKLSTTTARGVVLAMKPIFARHGIPNVIISDNGPQYTSQEFRDFATTYNFQHLQVALTTPKGMEKQNERSKL